MSSNVNAAAGGCLGIVTVFIVWLVGVCISLALTACSLSAIAALVYFIFTGEWIGNAPFLN